MASASTKSSKLVAELQGGVGNQIFVVAAGLAQAIRLGVPLELDASLLYTNNSSHVSRNLEIEPLLAHIDYPISVVGTALSPAHKYLREIAVRFPGSSHFREPSLNYSPTIEHVAAGQTLTGYFQSPHYFTHGSAELLQQAFTAVAKVYTIEPSAEIFMHIRRGDYLLARHQGHHGLASIEYFDRGAAVVRKLTPNAKFRVFTDSPEHIAHDFLERWDAKLDDNQLEVTPLEALLMLAANSGLIMSNSSFSWWAAWIAQARNPEATFIAPRPWLANGASAHTLLPASWLTLGA